MPLASGWAIVIGVSRYWQSLRCLGSAVPDALRFRDWLLEPTGGALDPKRVYLLLSPMPKALGPEFQQVDTPEPDALHYAEATHDNIVRAVNDLRKRCQLEESQGRLYFFFSGHQVTARVAFADQEALLPTDFTPDFTTRALELRTIAESLESTGRPEQFLFIDGCRDVPWERKEQRIGGMPEAYVPNPNLRAPQQFIFFATSPRQKAFASQQGQHPHGLFTQALLEALRGKGSAKVWDSARRRYLVRVNRVLDFVVREVGRQSLKLSEGEIEQVPRQAGERGGCGGSDPILATLRAEDVPPESLTVSVDPEVCQPQVTLMVERDNQFVAESTPPAAHPVTFSLPPREYSLLARAVGYEPSEEFWPIELYEPSHVAVTMKELLLDVHFRMQRDPRYLVGDPFIERYLGKQRKEHVPSSMLFVEAWDPRLFVSVTDASGEPVGQGLGAVSLEGASPGYYRAEVFGPEGRLASRLIELFGYDERIRMEEPSRSPGRLLREVLQAVRATRDTRTLWEVPGLGYSVLLPQLSTLLTVVGYASTGRQGLRGALPSDDALGLPSSARASVEPSGQLYLLFAAESETGEASLRFLESIRVRLWPMGQPMTGPGKTPWCSTAVKGVAACLLKGDAGPSWFSLEVPGQPPMLLPVMLEERRLNLVIVECEVLEERSPEGQATVASESRIFRYCPELPPARPIDYDVIRILEQDLAQRCHGTASDAYRLALIDAERRPGDLDPLGVCAAGYLLLRHERKDALRSLLERLEQRGFHGPDAIVLRAALEERPPDETLARLGTGLPLFAEGLLHLRHMVRDLDAPRASELTRLAARRLALPWTAFPATLLFPEPR